MGMFPMNNSMNYYPPSSFPMYGMRPQVPMAGSMGLGQGLSMPNMMDYTQLQTTPYSAMGMGAYSPAFSGADGFQDASSSSGLNTASREISDLMLDMDESIESMSSAVKWTLKDTGLDNPYQSPKERSGFGAFFSGAAQVVSAFGSAANGVNGIKGGVDRINHRA